MRNRKLNLVIFVVLLTAMLPGCKKIAEATAPEAQPVSSQVLAVVDSDRIYDYISINGISVGGLTKEEAAKKVTEELMAPLKNQKVIVKKDDKTWPLELSQLDYKYDVEKGVEEAFNVARTGTTEERYEKITELETSPYEITLEPSYDKTRITQFLSGIAEEVDVPPVEPSLKRENKEVEKIPGSDGLAVDISETQSRIELLTDELKGGEVALVVVAVPPSFSENELLEAHSLIGSYSTPVTGSASRDINLTIASGYINGVSIYPGEVFSTNNAIGPTTYERGYRNAPVIVNGKLEDGIGGGVCQVSSTLYNAVLFAELEVVQRRNHGLVVGYCPIGRDATLAEGYIDFEFRNDTDYPVYIESYLEGNRLYVNIYGHETRPANRTIDFESIYVAERSVDVYKKIMIDGVVTDRVWINNSTYKAPAAEAAPEEEPPAETTPETPAPPVEEPVEEPVDNSTPPEWIGASEPEPAPPFVEPAPEIDFDTFEQE